MYCLWCPQASGAPDLDQRQAPHPRARQPHEYPQEDDRAQSALCGARGAVPVDIPEPRIPSVAPRDPKPLSQSPDAHAVRVYTADRFPRAGTPARTSTQRRRRHRRLGCYVSTGTDSDALLDDPRAAPASLRCRQEPLRPRRAAEYQAVSHRPSGASRRVRDHAEHVVDPEHDIWRWGRSGCRCRSADAAVVARVEDVAAVACD